ncbi:MAG: NusA-like transcription termination signal-binding factor [Thermoplasmatota archaeon]
MQIRLDEETIKLIALFESVTRAEVRDCVVFEDAVVFIVNRGQAGAAIGEGGERIHRLRALLRRSVEVVEWADTPERFIRNLFHGFSVGGVHIERRGGRLTALVSIPSSEKPRAIGKQGRNLSRVRAILARHFGEIEAVVVT